MQIPPFLQRRGKNAPTRSRTAQLRAILRAAQSVEGYRDRLRSAGLHSPDCLDTVRDVEGAVSALNPISLDDYGSIFPTRTPAWLRSPFQIESRSAYLMPYAEARSGLEHCDIPTARGTDLYAPYSSQNIAGATTDLYNLGRSLAGSTPVDLMSDHAVVAFCGFDAGLLTDEQREKLWRQYQVPLFEQFLGTDGRVVAAECEVHAGLHIRPHTAIVECVNGQLAMTSLTDEKTPALRVLSKFTCGIERETCDCGRSEPRIVHLRAMEPSATAVAA